MFPDTDFMCFFNVETSLYMDENVETSLFLSVISQGRKCGNINGMSVFTYGVTLSWRIITSHIGVIYLL